MQEILSYLRNHTPNSPTHAVTLVFGTGLSSALSDHSAKDWKGQIRYLAAQLTKKEQRRLGVERILKDGAKSHHFTGLLHILRRELGVTKWAKALKDCIQGVVDTEKSVADKGVQNWNGLFEKLGDYVRDGRVRLATTNFDDILARRCRLNVISRNGLVFNPLAPESAVPILPAAALPGTSHMPPEESQEAKRVVLQLWGNSEDQSGRLNRDIWNKAAGVLHLHGWYQRPDDLVVDPVDYHLASERAVSLDLTETLLTRLLRSRNETVVFVGAGDGMLDDHFIEVWNATREKDDESSFDPSSNLWLINRVCDSRLPAKLQKILDQRPGNTLRVMDLLTPVRYGAEDPTDRSAHFELAPLRVGDILTQRLGS